MNFNVIHSGNKKIFQVCDLIQICYNSLAFFGEKLSPLHFNAFFQAFAKEMNVAYRPRICRRRRPSSTTDIA